MDEVQREEHSPNVHNGRPLVAPNHSPSMPCAHHTCRESSEEDSFGVPEEDPPVVQIERDLDELTYSGAAINDLEMQLIRSKHQYQKVLVDGKVHVDMLRRKLHPHIVKSEPYIHIWRRARQVQEMSNRAAARYDKANSQHTAAKEMIRVAESQLAAAREEQAALEEPSSPSPLDLAWQEMLNHATGKVVVTEKERRDSELEHRRVLEECKKVMDEYRTTERKLRTHIVKSRPYFQERYRVNQQLAQLKETMKNLEQKINESKQSYSASLKRLEVLNEEIHERRGTLLLDPRHVSSAGTSPEMRRSHLRMRAEEMEGFGVGSVDSLQMVADYSGSTSSLPSIGILSTSSESDSKSLDSSANCHKMPSNIEGYSQEQNGVPGHHMSTIHRVEGSSVPSTSSSSNDQETVLFSEIPGQEASQEQNRVPGHHLSTIYHEEGPSVPSSSGDDQETVLSCEDTGQEGDPSCESTSGRHSSGAGVCHQDPSRDHASCEGLRDEDGSGKGKEDSCGEGSDGPDHKTGDSLFNEHTDHQRIVSPKGHLTQGDTGVATSGAPSSEFFDCDDSPDHKRGPSSEGVHNKKEDISVGHFITPDLVKTPQAEDDSVQPLTTELDRLNHT